MTVYKSKLYTFWW